MTTVLVANRGEIAVRVFRTARRLGFRTVAVYSEADAGAPFVRLADTAHCIGPPPAAQSYLRADRILEAAARSRADLIHPGFGFLSENATFGRAVADAGFVFVGPPPGVLAAMGGKDEAKRIAVAAGVPVLPGYSGAEQDDDTLLEAARSIGFPVIVKPAAGGGGKGMSVVNSPDELAGALASARRVAASAFGDPRLILERYLTHPRHVEVQIVADDHGHVLHLGERDCSLQRRHQKILEESPSPAISAEVRLRLCGAAVDLARHVGYRNAGTCEFLVDAPAAGAGRPGTSSSPDFGFIEMNARLQVEHPVTEMVTGLDLVELQLRIALGEALPFTQAEVASRGHAVEVRLYAEDPDEGFIPQSGRITHLVWPTDARVDSGVAAGSVVTTHYDPMLAKIIVHGADRAAALARLDQALAETEVLGLRTNLAFLRAVSADPVVTSGQVTTTWLEPAYQGWTSGAGAAPAEVLALAAAAEAARILASVAPADGAPNADPTAGPGPTAIPDPWAAAGPWRLLAPAPVLVVVQTNRDNPGDHPRFAGERVLAVHGPGPFEVSATAGAGPWTVERGAGPHAWLVDGRPASAVAAPGLGSVWWEALPYDVALGPRPRTAEAEAGPARLGAPMPGTVIAVRVAAGDAVTKGQELVVVEAMKMELAVRATADGIVTALLCAPGDQVVRGQVLVDMETAAAPS